MKFQHTQEVASFSVGKLQTLPELGMLLIDSLHHASLVTVNVVVSYTRTIVLPDPLQLEELLTVSLLGPL